MLDAGGISSFMLWNRDWLTRSACGLPNAGPCSSSRSTAAFTASCSSSESLAYQSLNSSVASMFHVGRGQEHHSKGICRQEHIVLPARYEATSGGGEVMSGPAGSRTGKRASQ